MNRNPAVALLLLLLAALLLCGNVGALSGEDLDYSSQLPCDPVSLSPAELLSLLPDITLGMEEIAYLETRTDLVFSFHDTVPDTYIRTELTAGSLIVYAQAFDYTAPSGQQVVFTPQSVALGDRSVAFAGSGEAFRASFPGVTDADGNLLHVSYTAAIHLPADVGTDLANLAFRVGSDAAQQLSAYRSEYADYIAAAEAYRAYCEASEQYSSDLAAYQAYLAALALYESEATAYEEYLDARAEYERNYRAYTTYLLDQQTYLEAYRAYTDALAALLVSQDALQAYMAYLAECRACSDRLSVMEYIMHPDYHLYSTLLGNTVAEVVSRKNELIMAGCNASDIETAANCTETLRRLLSGYAACSSEEERYNYYRAAYEELNAAFAGLQKALYSLFENALVQSALEKNGKLERFVQFVAQLYVVRACMDDSLPLDTDWYIQVRLAGKKETYGLAEALNGLSPVPADKNSSDPRTNGWPPPCAYVPADEVLPEEPVAPEPVERPNEPAWVAPPSLTMPEPVPEPLPPLPVDPPGTAPVCPVTDPVLTALADAVSEGRLTERAPLPDTVLYRSVQVPKCFSRSGAPLAVFYDSDGKTLLGVSEADPDGRITYTGATPIKEPDERYLYLFSGWVDAGGNQILLPEQIRKDTSFYATYTKQDRYYTVTWMIGERQFSSRCLYGQIPVCPADTEKEPDALVQYIFAGWDKHVGPVTGDTVYTATYDTVRRQYSVCFITAQETVSLFCQAGDLPVPPDPASAFLRDGWIYTFLGWDKELSPVTQDVVYTALYRQEAFVYDRVHNLPAAVLPDGRLFTVTADSYDLSIRSALRFAAEEQASLLFRVGDLQLSLPATAVRVLADAGVTSLKLRPLSAGTPGMAARVSLSLEDETGSALTAFPEGITLGFSYTLAQGRYATICRVLSSGSTVELPTSYRDGSVFAGIPASGVFLLRELFPISVGTQQNGAVATDGYTAAAGMTVPLRILPATGYRLLSVHIVCNDTGEAVPFDGTSFLMPRGAVTITAYFEKAVYTVQFISNGKVISTQSLTYGQAPALPPDPSDPDGAFLFSGWSPAVVFTVTADAVYEAQYVPRSTDRAYGSGHDNNRLFTLYLPIAGAAVLLTGGICVGYRLRKKQKEKAAS